jgi:predicted O-methyltransferase YrrM
MTTQKFTKDFTTQYASNWALWLQKFAARPNIQGLEVGCFEGRTSIWFLDNILQAESSSLICIDPWCQPCFTENLRNYQHKVRWMKSRSAIALRDARVLSRSIHFAYVDGNHSAPSVLEDAILVLPLLVPGGILIFDDYHWESQSPNVPQSMPKLAIDAFLSVFQDQIRLIHKQWQVCVEKL